MYENYPELNNNFIQSFMYFEEWNCYPPPYLSNFHNGNFFESYNEFFQPNHFDRVDENWNEWMYYNNMRQWLEPIQDCASCDYDEDYYCNEPYSNY